MPSPFLTHVEFLSVAGFSGLIAQCHFFTVNYHDDLFSVADIDFPDHLASAIAKRRAEYLAGRHLARLVLAPLGYPHFTLLRGDNREPIWPPLIAGAISHNADTALCAAQHKVGSGGVGIDVETQMSFKRAQELWSGIVGEVEYLWLHQQPQPFNLLLTVVFSAKESLFKALYPQVCCYFDFLDARIVALDSHACTFELELQKTLTSQCFSGRRFSGQYWCKDDNVTTIIYF